MEIPVCRVGSLVISPAIWNGAGTVKSVEQVREMARSSAGAITVGSITVKPRTGNEGDVFFVGSCGSLNSLGIPNGGIPYYRENLPEMARIAHDAGKPLIVSVAGFKENEFVELAEVAVGGGADGVELNFGCPNIWDDGSQKDIFSFMPHICVAVIRRVRIKAGGEFTILAKVSPYSNPNELKRFASVIGGPDSVGALVTSNTSPNAFALGENGRSCITPGGGLSGFAGLGFKWIALGQAKQWRDNLSPETEVIGVGGISTGADMADYFLGARVAGVQVATALLKTKQDLDPSVFDRILLKYEELPEPVAVRA